MAYNSAHTGAQIDAAVNTINTLSDQMTQINKVDALGTIVGNSYLDVANMTDYRLLVFMLKDNIGRATTIYPVDAIPLVAGTNSAFHLYFNYGTVSYIQYNFPTQTRIAYAESSLGSTTINNFTLYVYGIK